MPQALAFITTLATAAFGATAGAAIGVAIGNIVVNLIVSALISAIFSGGGRGKQARAEAPKHNFQQSDAPRLRHYGEVKAGGSYAFYRAKGDTMFIVVIHGHGEIDSILKRYLNGAEVTLDGSDQVTESQYQFDGASQVQIFHRLGLDTETHYSELTAEMPEWTTAHLNNGLSTTLCIFSGVPATAYNAMYPTGIPTYAEAFKSSKILDVRTSTTAYTDNMALCIADFIESEYGLNQSGAADVTSFSEAADRCDDAITLKVGGTVERYSMSGSYALTEKPGGVLDAMLAGCDGELYLTSDGNLGLSVGHEIAPTVSLSSDHLLAIKVWGEGVDKLAAYNRLTPAYTDRELDYTRTSADPYDDTELQTLYDELLQEFVDYTFVPHHAQVRRLCKIKTKRDNPEWRGVLVYDMHGLKALGERFVTVDLPDVGFSGDIHVDSIKIAPDLTSVEISVSTLANETYDWDPATEEGTAPTLPAPETAEDLPTPTNFVKGTVTASSVDLTWDTTVFGSLIPVLGYKKNADSVWTDIELPVGDIAETISGLTTLTAYDFRLAYKTAGGTLGSYATETATTL